LIDNIEDVDFPRFGSADSCVLEHDFFVSFWLENKPVDNTFVIAFQNWQLLVAAGQFTTCYARSVLGY
tara:strand:+ start:547 stop:750 length:204 start_codon:yes stop_codon:yes gene_type:complete